MRMLIGVKLSVSYRVFRNRYKFRRTSRCLLDRSKLHKVMRNRFNRLIRRTLIMYWGVWIS